MNSTTPLEGPSPTPVEQIKQNLGHQVSKMSEEVQKELRLLITSIERLQKDVEASAESLTDEIKDFMQYLHNRDKELTEKLAAHVNFVDDSLRTKAIISNAFKEITTRYAKPQA